MRTHEQIQRVCNTLKLDRRQRSIVFSLQSRIKTQSELTNIALQVSTMSEKDQLTFLKHGQMKGDSPHTLHMSTTRADPNFVSGFRVSNHTLRNGF
jgi:hypothetical protein